MDQNLISMIIGYFIIINMIGISLIWLNTKTKFIKLSKSKMNLIFTILSLIGGFIGVLVGAEMMNYEQDNRLFRRWIPFFLFLEGCVVCYIIYINFE